MEKEVLLLRVSRTAQAVYGILLVVRGVHILGVYRTIENAQTLFPVGVYDLRFEMSDHFQTKLYEVYGIPGRSECKIHVANKPEQLKGCIGIGMNHQDIDGDGDIDLAESRVGLAMFHDVMAGTERTKIRVSAV